MATQQVELTEEEILNLIPVEFHKAVDLAPDDFTLRCAIADKLEELGKFVEADCIRWSVEKRRWTELAWRMDLGGSGDSSRLTQILYDAGEKGIGDLLSPDGRSCAIFALRRLVWRWLHLTPEQREECWKWNPPTE